MNKFFKTLSAAAVLCGVPLAAQAQTGLKIAVIDIAKIYNNHYETQEQMAKLKVDEAKAQAQIDQMNKEGQALVDQYKELDEQAKNPAATADAKAQSIAQAKDKYMEIQAKEKDITDLMNDAKQKFQQRIENFRTSMMQEISSVAVDVAKRDGDTLLIDKSGPSLIGIAPVIYADPSYDITDQVMAEINKNRPRTTNDQSPGPATSSPEPSSGGDSTPKITVPGITPQ